MKKRKVIKWGFVTLEIFHEHKEVILTRKPLGSDRTKPEVLFMSTKGFSHIARQFLKSYHPKPRRRKSG